MEAQKLPRVLLIFKTFLSLVTLTIIADAAHAGTPIFIRDLNPDTVSSDGVRDLCSEFVEFNGNYYFCANTSTGGSFWTSDGTSGGTSSVSTSYAPKKIVAVNGELFFVDKLTGGLFKSDGSDAGTTLIMDFSRATLLADAGGKLIFLADDGISGLELWASNGTTEGTIQLADIRPGSSGFPFDFDSTDITKVGESIFFVISDLTHGEELWVTQGTLESTTIVKDIYTGTASGQPSELTALNDQLIFFASNESGQDLWVSDGTDAGTKNLTSFERNSITGFCGKNKTISHNSIVYFCASGGTNGAELWSTDGTVDGTNLVKDINPEFNSSSSPDFLLGTMSNVFFTAKGSNSALKDLWVTDGTEEGTFALTERAGISLQDITAISEQSGELLFVGEIDDRGVALWITDVANQRVSLIKDFDSQVGVYTEFPSEFIVSKTEFLGSGNSSNYFVLDIERNTPTSLWKTDSSSEGTIKVGEFPFSGSFTEYEDTKIEFFFAAPQAIFFAASDPDQTQIQRIWTENETGLKILKEIQPTDQIPTKSAIMSDSVEFDNHFYFVTTEISSSPSISLWRSDGSGQNTVKVSELCPSNCDFESTEIVATSLGVFILIKNQDLWFSDGTTNGTNFTKKVGDDFGGSSRAYKLTALGDEVIFVGWDITHDMELWRSDGTPAGTLMIKDIKPGGGSGFRAGPLLDRLDDLTDFAVIGNTIYFVADDGTTGPELWRSNGTTASTRLVKDIFTLGNLGSYPQDLTAIGDTLFFSAFTPERGYELWKSRGTASSTVLVKDIEPKTYTVEVVKFTCETVGFIEICRDRLVEEVRPYSSLPKGITKLGNKAIFRAYTREHGYETWVSDGSSSGTFMLRDIWVGTNGSTDLIVPPEDGDFEEDIDNIRRWKNSVVMGNELFFAAKRSANTIQLWKTDGSKNGTRLIKEIGNANFSGKNIEEFAINSSRSNSFYFTAKSESNDTRLWTYNGLTNRAVEFSNHPTPSLNNPNTLFFFNEDLYFGADNGIKGHSLWMIVTDSDGDGIGDKIDKDDDNDGMPDRYELSFGFDPLDPFDALLDPDQDGRNNITEYRQRTNPLEFDEAKPFVIAPILQLLLD